MKRRNLSMLLVLSMLVSLFTSFTMAEASVVTKTVGWEFDWDFYRQSSGIIAAKTYPGGTLLGQKPGISLVTSSVINSFYDNAYHGTAGRYSGGALQLSGYGNSFYNAINFVPEVGEMQNMNKLDFIINATGTYDCAPIHGMTAFVSENERSFYLFGYARRRADYVDTKYVLRDGEGAAITYSNNKNGRPFVAKVKNNAVEIVAYDTEKEWTNAYTNQNNDLVWSVSLDNGVLSWTVKSRDANINPSATADSRNLSWSGSASADTSLTQNYRYPCALYGSSDDGIYLRKVSMKGLEEREVAQKTYSVNFYTENDQIENRKTFSGGETTTVGKKDGISFVASNVNKTFDGRGGISATGFLYAGSTGGYANRIQAINFVPEKGEMLGLNSLNFRMGLGRMAPIAGVMAFISEDEKSYYLFGYNGKNGSPYNNKFRLKDANGNNVTYNRDNTGKPFVAKVKNNVAEILAYDTADQWDLNWDTGRDLEWNVSIENGTVSWSVRSRNSSTDPSATSDGIQKTWSGSAREDMTITKDFRYPCAFVGEGDYTAYLRTMDIGYDAPEVPYIEEDFTGYGSVAQVTATGNLPKLVAHTENSPYWLVSGAYSGSAAIENEALKVISQDSGNTDVNMKCGDMYVLRAVSFTTNSDSTNHGATAYIPRRYMTKPFLI